MVAGDRSVTSTRIGTAVLAAVILVCGGCTSDGRRDVGGGAAPETFFALTAEATRIVEVNTDTGKVLRTVIDARRDDGVFVQIDDIDLAPDRRALYYSVGTDLPNGSIWRIALPDGKPQRIADGLGTSVSPDGLRLAFVAGVVLHVRDIANSADRSFPDAVGELGGSDTAWSPDGRRVAFATHAADGIGGTSSVDTNSGNAVHLTPTNSDPTGIYAAYSGRYRPSDGALAVVCCQQPNLEEDAPSHGRRLVFHDPATGAEKGSIDLPFRAGRIAFDQTGKHLLFTTWPDGVVYHHHNGAFTRLPDLTGVSALDW